MNLRLLPILFLMALLSCGCSSVQSDSYPAPAISPSSTMDLNYSFTVRSLGYKLELIEVRFDADAVYTLSRLSPPPPDAMVGMALDSLTINLQILLPIDSPPANVVHFIIGERRHTYEPPAGLRFVSDPSNLPDAFHSASALPLQ